MKNPFKKMFNNQPDTVDQCEVLNEFINTQKEVDTLPQFSAVEKVQFDNEISISHLYYSSKIEGSNLEEKSLNKAIHA